MSVAAAAGSDFAPALIAWQRRHGRHDLPWQRTRDAYRIWLSEIMLQQTQVTTVIPYYARFLERFPDIAALAAAPVDSVLELWAGLGYYARARNLHRCAQVVVAEHDGQFPRQPEVIAQLPGVGRSTAAAISAFAFGARAAILDGNVKRVLARCFGVDGFPGTAPNERRLWSLAESLLPSGEIEAYTQGLMDLGATLCTRAQPDCARCPLAALCVAQASGRQSELPAARPKKSVPERRVTYCLFSDGERVLLERRPPTGIWGGLLCLPELAGEAGKGGAEEASEEAGQLAEFARRHGCGLLSTRALPELKHSFTHFRLRIAPRLCQVERVTAAVGEPGWQWLAYADVATAALPAPIRVLLEQAAHLA